MLESQEAQHKKDALTNQNDRSLLRTLDRLWVFESQVRLGSPRDMESFLPSVLLEAAIAAAANDMRRHRRNA